MLARVAGTAGGLLGAPGVRAPSVGYADTAPRNIATAAATVVADWDVPGGHFYTQGVLDAGASGASDTSDTAAGAAPGAAGDLGFAVTDVADAGGADAGGADAGGADAGGADAGGARFWSAYRALGGPAQLGFPVSRPFAWRGARYQATEAALLAWDAAAGRAAPAPVFALLAALELDEWLVARGIPTTSAHLRADPVPSPAARLAWLTHPALRAAFAAPDEATGVARFGLPMGAPERFGPYLAQRFEAAVLQLWLDDVPGQPAAGTISLAQVGGLLRELARELAPDSGALPLEAFVPQAPPAPRPPPAPELPPRARAATPPAALQDGKHLVVSVAQQWWYAYQDQRLLYDGPVTTGQPELFTPTGEFAVLSRHSPYTFVSPWPPGSKYWYAPSPTTYALRITDTGVFLHDAPWRPYFGPGTNVPHVDPDGVWRTGSHGCINLPFAAARWLWEFAPVGTPVHVAG